MKKAKEPIVKVTGNYKSTIQPNQSITCMDFKGFQAGKSTTFNMFDVCTYGSYNLTYLGYIVAITANTVTIVEEFDFDKWKGIKAGTYTKKHEWDKPQVHRMKIERFAHRNYDFDLEQVRKDNHETSMYL